MKSIVHTCLEQAFAALQRQGLPVGEVLPVMQLERPKASAHGDWSSNLALILAKSCKMPPRQLAEALVAALPAHEAIEKIDIAGVGFLNFFLKKSALSQVVVDILQHPEQFGQLSLGKSETILIEFVSANPTGPLHVGHGRGAAFGASLGAILRAAGFQTRLEYYVNDAGRQMDILAVSVWLRYLSAAGERDILFPANGYQGDYVKDIAQQLLRTNTTSAFIISAAEIYADLPLDEPEGGDKERYIDALIARAKHHLGEPGFQVFHQAALSAVLADIRSDLAEFGVHYDAWFSEKTLFDEGAVPKMLAALEATGTTFKEAGALWFRSTALGDEKDRVLVRDNGQPTYFAADIAYHWHKYQRGYDRLIDLFGADHHGYMPRLRAAMQALGHDTSAFEIHLVQFATLYRGKERVQMSTRSGSFVTLRALREEVGNDAARFFYVLRKPEQHMTFDLALAVEQSQENPVYYIQYAHARICSVLKQLASRGLTLDKVEAQALALLQAPQELTLLTLLNQYTETLEMAALQRAPHLMAYYLKRSATGLHAYYNAVVLLCEEASLRHARLSLLQAVRIVLQKAYSY